MVISTEFRVDSKESEKKPEPNVAVARNVLVSELAAKFQRLQLTNASPANYLQPQHPVKMKKQVWIPVNYTKQEELGRGAYGVVHKCFDKQEQMLFVAKKTLSQGKETLESAKNEIHKLKDMSHPRIIEYYGYKEGGNKIIIFMEYMPAGSLRQIIHQHGVIDEMASVKYTGQILEGLEYIHNIGIVHSDLKCDNILNDGRGNIKLGDFGIAVQKIVNEANISYFSSTVKGGGTPYWLAPEIMNGEGCGRRSDIWSLGCTIVEMLTGEPPYRKMPYLKFMTGLGNKTLSYNPNELVPKSSDRMKKFLSPLLQIDADKRPHSAVETMQIYKTLF